ncbi:MAG: L,D-transpeptidase [Prochlorococcaceae cyanobacterium]
MPEVMSPERFQDRWEAFKNEQQQVSGVWGLYEAIKAVDAAGLILTEDAQWALKFSEKPPAPAAPAGGLDPRGSEEAGLVGPKIAAPVKPGDSYLLVNDRIEQMEAFDHTGKLLWKIPCLARGQGADNDWKHNSTDTPPGLYKLGQLYPDYEQNPNPPCSDTAMSYGWYSYDMLELENQEAKVGRAGIMLHGGGSACGWPGAWAAKQSLVPTLGCIRLHNIELRDKVLPLYRQGTVYVGVFQEP